MIYKGYEGVLEVDEEAGELFGTVKGLRDVITFVGSTIEEARESFEKSVDFYLECCANTGKKPDRPYSGRFMVRVSSETHRELERIADGRQADLAEVASEALTSYVKAERRSATRAANRAASEARSTTEAGTAKRRGKTA